MDELRRLPAQEPRVETGPVRFGADWTGVFLRGDHALPMAWALRALLDGAENDTADAIARATLRGHVATLESCLEMNNG